MLGLLREAGPEGIAGHVLAARGLFGLQLAPQLCEAGYTVETRWRERERLPAERIYVLAHDPGEQLELTG